MSKRQRVVVLSGAGVSAESGLSTFRDSDGLWAKYRIDDVCTPGAWQRNPQKVLDFYDMRRIEAAAAQPNSAHLAIAALEPYFDVSVITQNVDDLHERAGSSAVVHLHGTLSMARSSGDTGYREALVDTRIMLGDCCPEGHQMRPDIVWFGEPVPLFELAVPLVERADKLLIVGTSLSVYPAASLIDYAQSRTERHLVVLDSESAPANVRCHFQRAGRAVPRLVEKWIAAAENG